MKSLEEYHDSNLLVQISENKGRLCCSTTEIVNLNERCKDLVFEIMLISGFSI